MLGRVVSGGIWLCKKYAVANHFLQSHIPPSFLLFNAVSAEVGVARKSCRKLFLCLIYSSFSNVVSAEVGVARKSCRKLFLCLTYPSFTNVVSAEVGVAWRRARQENIE